jgi:hypothetical protein
MRFPTRLDDYGARRGTAPFSTSTELPACNSRRALVSFFSRLGHSLCGPLRSTQQVASARPLSQPGPRGGNALSQAPGHASRRPTSERATTTSPQERTRPAGGAQAQTATDPTRTPASPTGTPAGHTSTAAGCGEVREEPGAGTGRGPSPSPAEQPDTTRTRPRRGGGDVLRRYSH